MSSSSKTWADRLIDPRSPDRRPRRAAYALPTMFTAGNVYLGFYALLETFQGSMDMVAGAATAASHFQTAAISIGVAVFLDGLDGRIARMTNTVSEFGREMDSLADSITFGIAPAVLAFAWGVQFVDPSADRVLIENLKRAGYLLSFLYLLCGAARLARFNIQKNPVPKNPGRPDRKYFVGMPIPSAAAALAAVVYAAGSTPIHNWIFSALWLGLVALLAFLMVSTWRYPSFKDLSLTQPRSPLTVVLIGGLIYVIWTFPRPVLLVLAVCYVGSGIAIRVGGLVRRWFRPPPGPPQHPRQEPEQQIG
jgi:CDP-diacylglycerol--serine O-phosphatidyltransferase